MNLDRQTLYLFGGVLALLIVSSVIGAVLSMRVKSESGRRVVDNLNARTRAWWIMAAIFGGALALGRTAVVIMFALTSFLALREFITLTPTRRADHRALFWSFFIILPLHYWTLSASWYGLFVILIPVYAFLFIPMRNALAGDTEHFLERTAKTQWGLMLCVYCVSHVPGLLMLDVGRPRSENVRLIFFLVCIAQLSDVLQYVWGKLCGKHPVAPKLSPNKTIEGLVGGGLSAVGVGAALWWSTPFNPWQAAGLAAVIVAMGFFGGLVMSAIKRDRGVKDYGEIIPGHGGVLDRIDSLCFAAPIFFHLVRWFWT
jgi:phosphatidate cytidylyltransferase